MIKPVNPNFKLIVPVIKRVLVVHQSTTKTIVNHLCHIVDTHDIDSDCILLSLSGDEVDWL